MALGPHGDARHALYFAGIQLSLDQSSREGLAVSDILPAFPWQSREEAAAAERIWEKEIRTDYPPKNSVLFFLPFNIIIIGVAPKSS